CLGRLRQQEAGGTAIDWLAREVVGGRVGEIDLDPILFGFDLDQHGRRSTVSLVEVNQPRRSNGPGISNRMAIRPAKKPPICACQAIPAPSPNTSTPTKATSTLIPMTTAMKVSALLPPRKRKGIAAPRRP